MAEAFRRLLWSIPLLAAFTVGLLSLFAQLDSVRPRLSRPLLYNSSPVSAQGEAQNALDRLVRGDESGGTRLVELGGAALPTVLTGLAARPIHERRRIAEALWPVALRMGFSAEDVWLGSYGQTLRDHRTPSPDQKLLFWERFTEEQTTELNPLAVQRLVKRIATSDAQLRTRELRALDTFALPNLVGALGRVSRQEQINHCRRLVAHISHATGKPFSIAADANLTDAQRIVTQVRLFWDEKGPQWTQARSFELVLGHFVQTEYVKWLTRTLREVTRFDRGQLTDEFARDGIFSGSLLIACLVGVFGLGPFIASAIQIILLSIGGFRIERFGLRLVLTATLATVTAWSLRRSAPSYRELLITAALVGAALGTFILQRELSDRLDWRTHHVLSKRSPLDRIIAVGHWIAPAVPTLLPMVLVEGMTWMICLEVSAGRDGVGTLAMRALLIGNIDHLMAFSLTAGLLTLGLQLVSDLVLGDFEAGKAES